MTRSLVALFAIGSLVVGSNVADAKGPSMGGGIRIGNHGGNIRIGNHGGNIRIGNHGAQFHLNKGHSHHVHRSFGHNFCYHARTPSFCHSYCMPHNYCSWSSYCWLPSYNCCGFYCNGCWYYYYEPYCCYLPITYIQVYTPVVVTTTQTQVVTTNVAQVGQVTQVGPAAPAGPGGPIAQAPALPAGATTLPTGVNPQQFMPKLP